LWLNKKSRYGSITANNNNKSIMTQNLPYINVQSLDFQSWQLSVGLVTPEIASQLLALNFERNRNITPTAVKRYARLQLEKKWLFSEPVKFATNGQLIDGQHRLNAVIQSGIEAPFLIVTGYPFESAQVLDQGRSRTAIQLAQIRGKEAKTIMVSTLRAINEFSNTSKFVFSMAEVVALCEIYKKPLTFALQYSDGKSAYKNAAFFAAVAMASVDENHARLDEFLKCFQSNWADNESDRAATELRAWIGNNKAGSGTERKRVFEATQTAISHFLEGTYPKFIKPTKRILWAEKHFSIKEMQKALDDYGDIYL
jgi:hypothetical protein